jgi:hypothetical protein
MAIKKNIKFDLPIGGIRAKNIQEIREHFTLEILEYARSGKLVKWLLSRKLQDEMTAVQALSGLDDDALLAGLCTVFSVSPRQVFLNNLTQLKKEFSANTVDLRKREEILNRAFDELAGSTLIAFGLEKDNPLATAINNIAASLENWRGDIKRYQRNTEFREKFGDSLLVYVYGKVKAGKSSIGNYVAYGHGDPPLSIIDAAEPTPEFFFEAATKEDATKTALNERRKFAVGACETTALIQGFNLSGLTWIDSPSLHSKTQENGGLAQEYVAAADLVLYPMSSSQPGRARDLEEIADLLHKGKRVEVVITRCDVTYEDEDDDGNLIKTLVMKSDENRTVQSEYVYKEILKIEQKQRDDQSEVLTVSVRYAEEHADDIAQIEKSGMNALFRKLTALTQSEGVRLKKETPRNNLRAFVNHIRTSAQTLRDELVRLEAFIKQFRYEFRLEQGNIAFENVNKNCIIPFESWLKELIAALDRFVMILEQMVDPQ